MSDKMNLTRAKFPNIDRSQFNLSLLSEFSFGLAHWPPAAQSSLDISDLRSLSFHMFYHYHYQTTSIAVFVGDLI